MKGILVVVLLVLLGLGGWWYLAPMLSEKSPTTKTTTSKVSEVDNSVSGASIVIKDFAYSPKTITVKAGEKVSVTNMDLMGHSVTADDGSFDTGILSQNENGEFVAPTTPGTYTFHCVPHPSITGTLVVE